MKIVKDINSGSNGININLGYEHDLSRYQIFECNYYNLDTFLKALITFPINENVFYNPASIFSDLNFSGTKSFSEAWNLCRFTQDAGYQQFINGLKQIKFMKSDMESVKKDYSVVGYSPNVAKFLNGNPSNMKRKMLDVKKTKITVMVECSYSSFTERTQVVNRGICIINLIEYLEKHGFQVCLKNQSVLVEGKQMVKINVPIKRDNERLNIKLAYFPLVNPSFLRRLIFRAIEIIDGLDKSWQYGYGYPYKMDDVEIRSLENTIYISTPAEMGINGYSLEEDFNNFVNYIDNKYDLSIMKGESEKCHKKVYGKRV